MHHGWVRRIVKADRMTQPHGFLAQHDFTTRKPTVDKRMDAVKLHLAATVMATQACTLYSGAAPYFPIEISRTAASSPSASRALATGFATLLATMLYTKTLNAVTFTMWAGLDGGGAGPGHTELGSAHVGCVGGVCRRRRARVLESPQRDEFGASDTRLVRHRGV